MNIEYRYRLLFLLGFACLCSLLFFVDTKVLGSPGDPPPGAPPPELDIISCSEMNKDFSERPDHFAPPTDVYGDGTSMLLNALYCANEQVKLQVGDFDSPDTDLYIWNEIYLSRDGLTWEPEPLELEGDETNGDWIVGAGSVDAAFTDAGLREMNFFVAYVCKNNGTDWDCGCSDSTCGIGAFGKWSLQSFHTPPPLTYCTKQNAPSGERIVEAIYGDTIFCWTKNLTADNAENFSESGSNVVCADDTNPWSAPAGDLSFDDQNELWRVEYVIDSGGDWDDTFTECWRNTETTETSGFTFTVSPE
jgi:hypothetical protein